jgi:hypothetical protein
VGGETAEVVDHELVFVAATVKTQVKSWTCAEQDQSERRICMHMLPVYIHFGDILERGGESLLQRTECCHQPTIEANYRV